MNRTIISTIATFFKSFSDYSKTLFYRSYKSSCLGLCTQLRGFGPASHCDVLTALFCMDLVMVCTKRVLLCYNQFFA